MTIVSAKNLKKTYFSKITGLPIRALNDASIEVSKGEIFGILGPNGAGKTTLLNCLALLLFPDDGEVHLFGERVIRSNGHLLARINMTSGNSNFPWCMTVREVLKFYGYLYGLYGKELTRKVEDLIALLELGTYVHRRFDELSTGTKQRLALAKSLLNSPEVLFLDEPTIGLDPDVSLKIRAFIQSINREKQITILLTTHYMVEAESLAHRIAFLMDGQVQALGTPADLKEKVVANNLEEVFLRLTHKQEAVS